MSDFSFAPSPVENPSATPPGAALVNTNAVIQKVLQGIRPIDRDSIVLRCDELPFILGVEKDVEVIFSILLHMLLQKKAEVAKLYLHISCTKEEAETAQEFSCFHVQFHSNIVPSVNWYQQYEEQLNIVAAVLRFYNGQLKTNQGKNGSCIFSVSLPGKTL